MPAECTFMLEKVFKRVGMTKVSMMMPMMIMARDDHRRIHERASYAPFEGIGILHLDRDDLQGCGQRA